MAPSSDGASALIFLIVIRSGEYETTAKVFFIEILISLCLPEESVCSIRSGSSAACTKILLTVKILSIIKANSEYLYWGSNKCRGMSRDERINNNTVTLNTVMFHMRVITAMCLRTSCNLSLIDSKYLKNNLIIVQNLLYSLCSKNNQKEMKEMDENQQK